jgi:hypothetical protein
VALVEYVRRRHPATDATAAPEAAGHPA